MDRADDLVDEDGVEHFPSVRPRSVTAATRERRRAGVLAPPPTPPPVAPGPLPRTTCPSCGRDVPVRRGGELRQHKSAPDAEGWCPGVPGRPSVPGTFLLDRAAIRLDGGTQSRAAIDQQVVEDYLRAYRDGVRLPPLVVYYDGNDYWLADGFHRYLAQAEVGQLVEVEVRQGSRRDAVLASCGANASHGLRRTNQDKRRAVEVLLRDPEWSTWSDREIARSCAVTHPFVAAVRRELAGGNDYQPDPERPGDDPPSSVAAGAGATPLLSGSRTPGTTAPAETLPPPAVVAGERGQVALVPELAGDDRSDATVSAAPDGNSSEFPSQDPNAFNNPRWRAALEKLDQEHERATGQLANAERAPNDGYYTPLPHALACVRWLGEHGYLAIHEGAHRLRGHPDHLPSEAGRPAYAVEPAVGGGAWITALREIAPRVTVDRWDVNPMAPGLELELGRDEDAIRRSWLERLDIPSGGRAGRPRRYVWDLGLGNPPYNETEEGDLVDFLEVTLSRCWSVAFLLRETFTGTHDRLPFWRKFRPAWIVKLVGAPPLPSRPKWEGPGARENSDFVDTVLVVFTRPIPTETRFDWLEVQP